MIRVTIVLTTPDLLLRALGEFDDLPFSVVFVDEAHRVKNPRSKLAEALGKLSCTRRFGVTGTGA
jgi:DNA excision repair protein ERCC-6-like 2